MTLDQPTFHGETKPESSGAASTLSQAAFANPLEFLEVLKKDYSKIASSGGDMTKNDLILYAQQGDDEAGRNAAKIAVDHFDTLMSMTAESHSNDDGGNNPKVITASDLNQDIAYEKGTALSLAPEIALNELGDAFATASLALGTFVSVELAGISVVACPPALVITAPLAASVLGLTGYSAYHLATDGFTTVANAQQRQQVFAGWREINSGQVSPAKAST
jgi:hypothetical protein